MPSMSSVISPSADSIKSRLILPCRRSSTKFLRSTTSPHVFRRQLTCYGFQPSRDFTSTRLRFARRPPVLRFDPSSGFRNLSTVSSASKLAGLFHPAATPRVRSRSGASLPSQPSALVERLFLRAVAASSLANSTRLAPSEIAPTCDASQLRGFAPRRLAFIRFRLFTSTEAAPLFEFSSVSWKLPVLANIGSDETGPDCSCEAFCPCEHELLWEHVLRKDSILANRTFLKKLSTVLLERSHSCEQNIPKKTVLFRAQTAFRTLLLADRYPRNSSLLARANNDDSCDFHPCEWSSREPQTTF
jgi:hypothetical protein